MELLRYAVFAIFVASAVVALAANAVRTRSVNPFSRTGRLLRNISEPLVTPMERWIVKRGGNPQNAPWWIFGVGLFGGIVIIALAQWLVGEIAVANAMVVSGHGLARLVVLTAGRIVMLALIVRVIGSWFGQHRFSPWMRPAYLLTDWLVEPLRKIIPPFGMIDITPLVAWFLLNLFLGWIVRVI